jgi:hypothetical protein
MESEPESWQINAGGRFLTIGEVAVSALGDQRFRVQSPSGDEEVEGFAEGRQRAQELGWPGDV